MFRHQFFNTVAAKAVMGWVTTVVITGGFHDPSGGAGIARADIIIEDPLRDDQGWTAWDSKYAFSEKGMTPFGVVTRDFFKEMPSQFDAAVTIDASESFNWGFGVAGQYSPETGYSGLALQATDRQDGERERLLDLVDVDAVHELESVDGAGRGVHGDLRGRQGTRCCHRAPNPSRDVFTRNTDQHLIS
jgi:hypothetical protein